MKGKIVSFIFILLLVNIQIVHAEGLMTLHIHIKGTEDYQVHDEIVTIREYTGDQNESPIVAQNRTAEQATATFHLPAGTYWVDVRNIWVLVNLTEDKFFVYPYPLYEDDTYYTGNGQEEPAELDLTPAVVLSIAIIVCSIVFIAVSRVKKMKEKQKENDKKNEQKT